MSAFSGPQGKGAMRRHRDSKREAANERAAAVSHERTRAHRLRRCNCATGAEAALLSEVFGSKS